MLLISRLDVETIQISNMAARSASGEAVCASLKKAWEADRGNPEKAFACAACYLAYVHREPIASEKHKHLTQAAEALAACLSCREGWWLARFLYTEALQELPSNSYDDKASAEAERDLLLRMQKESGQKAPYFLCPYISKAKQLICQGDISGAAEAVEEGLKDAEASVSPHSLNQLVQPFADAIILFREVRMQEAAEKVKLAGLALFPRSAALASV
jgi:hypothetical protein